MPGRARRERREATSGRPRLSLSSKELGLDSSPSGATPGEEGLLPHAPAGGPLGLSRVTSIPPGIGRTTTGAVRTEHCRICLRLGLHLPRRHRHTGPGGDADLN